MLVRRERGLRRITVVTSMDETESAPVRILAALDPTGPSEEAERLALVLARAMSAQLVLVTVFPIIRLRSYVHSRHYESLLRREAERYLAGRADALRERAPDVVVGVETTGSVSAARGLHRLARELDAGMVVVGPSRRRSGGHRVPGPMGTRFAHGAPCPVAVASTGPPTDGLSRIGVAFAPTEDGEEALRAAAALADRAGATLQVIAVAGPLPWMDLVEPGFDGVGLQESYRRHVAHGVETAVAELPVAVPFDVEIPSGDPVDILARASVDLDLLVCGSRGHGPLGEVVVGSISHALLESVHCPVLVVPRSSGRAPDAVATTTGSG